MKIKVIFLLFILVHIYSKNVAQTPANLVKVVIRFVNTLSNAEQKSAIYSFDEKQRFLWTNLPLGQEPRPGIRYGDLSDSSRLAFHRVLSSTLSSQGYLKTTSIMQLDDILNFLYQKSKALLSQSVPKDIITNPTSKQRIDTYDGISTEDFSELQKAYLRFITQEYVHNFEHEKAHKILEKMDNSGFKNMYFAWIGSLENNKPHY